MSEIRPSLEETLLYTDIDELFQRNADVVGIALCAEGVDSEKTAIMILAGDVSSEELKETDPTICLIRGQWPQEEGEDKAYLFLETGPPSDREASIIIVEPSGCKYLAIDTPRLPVDKIESIRILLADTEWSAEASASKAQEIESDKSALQIEVERELTRCEAQLDLMSIDDYFVSKYLDELDPLLRPRFIEIYRIEIEALKSLDLKVVTLEDVRNISKTFYKQRDALNPSVTQEQTGPDSVDNLTE